MSLSFEAREGIWGELLQPEGEDFANLKCCLGLLKTYKGLSCRCLSLNEEESPRT